MKTTLNHARLGELANDIHRLDAAVIDLERTALDVTGSEADIDTAAMVLADARVQRAKALTEYFVVAEFLRRAESAPRAA